MAPENLDRLILQTRSALRRAHARRACWRALFIGSCLLLLIGCWYRQDGAALPQGLIGVWLSLSALLWWGLSRWRRPDSERAARALDAHYRLQDGLLSHLHLPRVAGFPALARQRLSASTADCRPAALPGCRAAGCRVQALGLALITALLFLLPDSAAYRQQQILAQRQAEELAAQVQAVTALRERIPDPALRQEIDRLLEHLRQARSREQALRVLALMEQHSADAQARLDPQADLAYLQRLGERMHNAADAGSRQLGAQLQQGAMAEAARQLQGIRQSLDDPDAFNQARATQLAGLGSQLEHNLPEGRNERLAAQLQELGGQLRELSQAEQAALREAERLGAVQPASMQRCQGCRSAAADGLDAIARQLQDLDRRRAGAELLARIRRGLAQCRNPGLGPGSGDGDRQLSQQPDEQPDAGGLAQVSVRDSGQGASSVRILEAVSGSGTRARQGLEQAHDYRAQMEAFVARQDIPAPLRSSVRAYFTSIHRLDEASETRAAAPAEKVNDIAIP